MFEFGHIPGSVWCWSVFSGAQEVARSSRGSQLCRRMLSMDFHVFPLNYTKSCVGRREQLCLCLCICKNSRSPLGPGPAEGMQQALSTGQHPSKGMQQAPSCWPASLRRRWESRYQPQEGRGGLAGGAQLSGEHSCLP